MTGSTLNPRQRYRQDLQKPDFTADPAQQLVVDQLQLLYDKLLARQRALASRPYLLRAILRWLVSKSENGVKGLYLWGSVGRGKTYLMDVFYDCLPFDKKMRSHFHRFMRRVHRELKDLAGHRDPLEIVAQRLADEALVICFDEFYVADITDAMLLGNLLDGLFQRGVTLVATSNFVPDKLWENGLQRDRFLPAIALLKQHTEVLHLDSPTDYRLRTLDQADLYHHPLNDAAERNLEACFANLAPDGELARDGVALEVENRLIHARRVADDVVWFDFSAICDGPRSQTDYIELAREYHAVMIANVPVFNGKNEDQARRFINLVDVFYDRNVKLVLSAAAPLLELYQRGDLHFEFGRTTSRLIEMQSHDYLARPHMP